MLVVFRVDASQQIGTGHVVRCLTLADALKASGHEARFICRRHEGHLGTLIEQRGYRVTLLEPYHDFTANTVLAHADWLGTSWHDDAEDCIALLLSERPHWLVVDHYALDADWQSELAPHCGHMLVIDDLADRKHSTNILLDQNLYPDMEFRYDELVSDDTVKLIGPRYAMLRNEFLDQHEQAILRKRCRNVLVFFGGVDMHDLTSTALDAIEGLDADIHTTVITGNSNARSDAILDRCTSMQNTTGYRNVDNIARLMLDADISIGAGGTTTWERCYLGLPSIVVTLADNQRAVNSAVASTGACVIAGDTDTSSDAIAEQLMRFIEQPDALIKASHSAFDIMQGHLGAAGVVAAMESYHD